MKAPSLYYIESIKDLDEAERLYKRFMALAQYADEHNDSRLSESYYDITDQIWVTIQFLKKDKKNP